MRKCKKQARAEWLEHRWLLSTVPTPAHVVVVMEENRGYDDIIGNPDAAYINSLAQQGALFTNSHGVTHPSQPNYIALFSGSTQGVTDDNGPVTFSGPDLASELAGKGLTFTGYAEELPTVGSQALTYQDYAKKHAPYTDFTDVPGTDSQPFTSFPADYTTLPTVSFVIPDLDDDMHDGTVAEGDQWLQANIGAYATWAQTHNSLLIVTWDEDSTDDDINQIPTIITGQGVKSGNYNENINHYTTLSTIEAMYALPALGDSIGVAPITDIWGTGGTGGGSAPTFLSTLPWASATTGYGTIHENASINGNPITLRGTVYTSGIGTHAASQIVYNLNGNYTSFISDVGVDDEVTAESGIGSVDFQVQGDGKVLYDSGVLTNQSPIAHINVSVAGVQKLTLLATNGIPNNIDYDHSDWAGAELIPVSATPTAPTAPSNLTALASSTSQINLSWTNTANNQLGFDIDRSTDGTNFTLAGSAGASATTYSDMGLTAGTKYYYRVVATNAVGISPASNIANATTLPANAIQVYLSTLTWASATVGYGTIQKNANINGTPIKLRGTVYPSGIGTHAVSQIVYNIAGAYTNFTSDVGIDDEVTGQGSVDFQVSGDGKVLFDSGVVTGASPVVHINVNVTGVQKLTLTATNGIAGSIDYDHADWAGAQLLGIPGPVTVPPAPSNLAAAAVSASEIDLSWTNNAVNQSGFEIDRSTDGTNFAFLANVAASANSFQSTPLAASTKYYYRVLATNSAGSSPASNIANATTFVSSPVTTNLSTLTWVSATVGYGTIQKNASINGNPLKLRGTVYPSGIGTHAVSQIVYNLAGKYTSFLSDVGVDDEVTETGSVDFRVIGDGKVLFDSGVVTNASPVVHINIGVAGVQQLTLLATNGVANSIDFDHSDWAGARLISAPPPTLPAAPSALSAVLSPNATSATLSWTDNAAGNENGFIIQRSSDGVNFAQIGTTAAGITTYADNSNLALGTTYSYRVAATNGVGNSSYSNVAPLPVSATTVAGTVCYVTLIMRDALGNAIPNYTGTVSFSSSDASAILPANYTFTAADNGAHTFAVTFKTAGSQIITATDTTNSANTGKMAGIQVTPAAVSGFTLNGLPATTPAGTSLNVTVTAHDNFGNTVTGYTGTVHFTSSDTEAILPANYTFTAADNGAHTFAVTLKIAGVQSVTATDTATSTLTGSATGTSVTALAATSLALSGLPTTAVAGTAYPVTLRALDVYGNVAAGYTGTVQFAVSDFAAATPIAYTFTAADSGIHTVSITFVTAGSQSLSAVDASNSAVAGQIATNVIAASAASLSLSGAPATSNAGAIATITITLKDAFGNIATGYTGSVGFTSSDPQAALPANYTFTAADKGTHSFPVTFKTAGLQSITATDGSNAGLTASQGNIAVTAGAAASFTFAGLPLVATAGIGPVFVMSAVDSFGNLVAGYAGTVHFTSSDTKAQLSPDYTFVAADSGTHSFPVAFETAGTQGLTVTDTVNSSIVATKGGIVVTAAAAASLSFSTAPANATLGIATGFTATALDTFGNVATGYAGTVHFTSSDTSAVLPGDYSFVPADNGVHTFSVKFNTAGNQSLTAADTLNTTLSASIPTILVNPSIPSSFVLSGIPTATTAGTLINFTLTVRDTLGNIAAGYTGTAHFTGSDASGLLPGDYTFTAGDGGVHVFSVTLKTAGLQSITATDTVAAALTASQTGITVNAAAGTNLSFSGVALTDTAGVATNATLTVRDAYGNIATGYAGTVHFSSTDAQAGLPANYTFTAADNGSHAFSVTMKTVGSQSITAADTVSASISGTQSGIVVTAAAAAKFAMTGAPSSAIAGTAFNLTLTAQDAFGNLATGYTGTVHLTSSDAQAALPANYTFTATDSGSHVFAVTLKSAGSQSVTITDIASSTLTASATAISVSAATASKFTLAGFPTSTTAGTAMSFTVTAFDAYGNIVTGYRGQVHFSASDSQAALPVAYTFTAADAGKHTFSATLKTVGNRTITVTDSANSALTLTSAAIQVKPAAAVRAVISAPATAKKNTAFSFTVTLLDAYGNIATGYTGTIHITSSDTTATLPADFKFTAAAAGVHTFTATLKKTGSQTLTATDKSTTSITGKSNSITVS